MFTAEETTFTDIYFFSSFLVLFSKKIRLQLKSTTFRKNVTEELNGFDIEDIGNLEDLLRIMFIHEECGNLKVLVGGGEFTRHINKKKKPGVLQSCRCPLCDKCFMREYFCSKRVKYCESVK